MWRRLSARRHPDLDHVQTKSRSASTGVPPAAQAPATSPTVLPPPPYTAVATYANAQSLQRPLRPSSPPPTYQPSSTSLLTSSPQVPVQTPSLDSDVTVLAQILTLHPWRRAWGPRPTTLSAALSAAARLGKESLAQDLLRAGAPIAYTSRYAAVKKPGALHLALRGPKPRLALLLITAHAQRIERAALPSCPAAVDGEGPAWRDARAEAARQTRYLLDARDAGSGTPLHTAADMGEADVARALVVLGAEVDAVDELGRTPLHVAAQRGMLETVRCLLEEGADARLIHRGLWEKARGRGPGASAGLLGEFEAIQKALRQVGCEREGEDDDGAKGDDGETCVAQAGNQPGRPLYSKASEIPASASGQTDPLSLSSRRKSSMAELGQWFDARQSKAAGSATKPAQQTATTTRQKPRKGLTSLLQTPEYTAWITGLDAIQAEHRAQKERDRAKVYESLHSR